MRITFIAAAALLATVGCAGGERTDADSAAAASPAIAATPISADRARTAARIANAIAANPAAADSILRANDHTRESFEKAIWDIAADSAMSAVYAAARTP